MKERVDPLAQIISEHVYGEFYGSLNECWTTCRCGAKIDATFGEGRGVAETFEANWGAHVAEAVRAEGQFLRVVPDPETTPTPPGQESDHA